MLNVKVKKFHQDAVIPSYAKHGDAGLDLTAVSRHIDADNNVVYDIGLGFEIPDGYVGLLFPRSSNASKSLLLSNSVGVIDSGYRGSVMMKYKLTERNSPATYQVGERIGQIIIIPRPEVQLIESDELSESERGAGGYGSTGA